MSAAQPLLGLHLLTVVLTVSCLLQKTSSSAEDLPMLIARGTHYDIGYSLGKNFRSYIQEYYREHPKLQSVWLPWSHTPRGKQVMGGFLSAAQHNFPQYVTELRGLAAGAAVDFDEALLANHRVELSALLKASDWTEPDSCSDLLVNNPTQSQVMLGHNEDNTPLIQNKSYVLQATVVSESGRVLEKFTAYCYPGELPGNAFGFNQHRVVTSVNGLYAEVVALNRVGRAFLNRAVLVADSVESAVNIATPSAAYGFSLNLGVLPTTSQNQPQLYNIELSPNYHGNKTVVSVVEVLPSTGTRHQVSLQQAVNGSYFHVNMYRRIKIKEIAKSIKSSIHRTARIEQFRPPLCLTDVKEILGDTRDTHYPIYRRPQPTDNETTLATAMFDLLKCQLYIYLDNPKTSRAALTVLPLPCLTEMS